jgi:hypothetical protein
MITVVSPNADSIGIPRLPQVCEVTGLCRSMIDPYLVWPAWFRLCDVDRVIERVLGPPRP